MENRTLKSEADENKEMLVIDGNAFYEIDLDCVRDKKRQENRQKQNGKTSANQSSKR